MPHTDFELLDMQLEALFVYDGTLWRINEPDSPQPALRFFLGRTRAGNRWWVQDVPDDLRAELERLAADEPVPGSLEQPPRHAAEYTRLLNQHRPIIKTDIELAYSLPETNMPHRAVVITPGNVHLLQAHFEWLWSDLNNYAPAAAVVVDNQAVAVCFCSRIAYRAAEAGVYTHADYRGRGFAVDTVRAWADAVRATGRVPLYETASTNLASQSVARKLGAVQYGVTLSIT